MFKKFVTCDETYLDGVEKVNDVGYMKWMGRSMCLFGSWPDNYEKSEVGNRGKRSRRIITIMIQFFGTLCSFLHILNNWTSTDAMKRGHGLIVVLISCVTMSRLIFIFTDTYWDIISVFFYKINLFNHQPKNDFSKKIHMTVHKQCHYFAIFLVIICPVGVSLYNVRALFVNISSGAYSTPRADVDYEYSIYYSLPIDLKRGKVEHIIFSIYNIFQSSVCVWPIFYQDILASLIVLHIKGHFTITIQEIEDFKEETGKLFDSKEILSPEDHKKIELKLKYFVKTHHALLYYVNNTSEAFSTVFFVYFSYYQVVLCIMLWQCSEGLQGLVQYGPLTLSSLFSLILLTVIMEMIGTMNELLETAVYCLPWELMDNPSRKTVLMMLFNVQRPLRMKALGLTDIGVKTMASIIKTSVSYLMFLKTLEN